MDFIKTFLHYVGIFFIMYLVGYSTFLFLSVIVGSTVMYDQRKKELLKNELRHDYYVPVTIIVPAYNEEVTVIDTIISLLSLEYTLYEIIIVDDESKDNTLKVIVDYFNMRLIKRPIIKRIECQPEELIYECYNQKVPITVISKKNGGKADSLNMGINASQYPYFICMDADSMLQFDSLEKIINPILESDIIIATGGLVRPSNGVKLKKGRVIKYKLPSSVLACMQTLEYERSFLASRLLLNRFNGNLIISGAFGLFKKDIVISSGGYDHSTMGEDMELVVKLHVFCRSHNIPYLIQYAPDAICWTQTPEKLGDLIKQRKRWHIGLFQCMWKHKKMFANPKYGAVGLISYLYFLIYELLSPFIELFGILTIILAFGLNLINVPFMMLFFLMYVVFGATLTITAFFTRIHTQNIKLAFSDVIKAILLCMLEITGLRFIMAFIRVTAFIGYKKKRLNWNKIERNKPT